MSLNKSRNLLLLGWILSAASLTAGIIMWHSPHFILQAILLVVGGALFLLFTAFTPMAIVEARRYNRIVSGRDLIARWTVDEHRWYAYCHLCEALNNRPDAQRKFWPRNCHLPRPSGVEVLFGKRGVIIEGGFTSLVYGIVSIEEVTWHDGPPPFIEFYLRCAGPDTNEPSYALLRIPTAAGHEPAAREVFRYYEEEHRRRTRK